MHSIFAIICPDCEAPLEPRVPAHGHDDEVVCDACAGTFVVRFGHAFAVPRPADHGAP